MSERIYILASDVARLRAAARLLRDSMFFPVSAEDQKELRTAARLIDDAIGRRVEAMPDLDEDHTWYKEPKPR